MSEYKWTTKDQAYLAMIAGKQVTTPPSPTTKEQELLKDIADDYVAVPSYEASDKGKVLAVNNAGTGVEWVEPSGGGGASVLEVNVTEDGGTYTCDKTAAEMWAAVPLVCFKYKMDDTDVIRRLFWAGNDEANGYVFVDSSNAQFEAASGTDYPTAGGIH